MEISERTVDLMMMEHTKSLFTAPRIRLEPSQRQGGGVTPHSFLQLSSNLDVLRTN